MVGIPLAKSASGPVDYDPMNRRTKRSDENGNYWQYAYNLRGEVQEGVKHLGTGAPLAGWQFGYGYDAIGNRTSTDRGGDSAGANRRNTPYTPNAVNAYTGRTVPGYFDVVGTSTPDAVITVNSLATERQSAEWRKEIVVANTSAAVSTPVTVAGSRSTSNDSKTGKVFTPKAAEVYTYDLDGNLLTDGRFIYTWDAENRLLTVQTSNAAALAGAAGIKRQFAYDYLGRRISKTNYLTVGSPGSYTYTLGTGSSVSRNLYSGWNLLAEIDATGVPLRCYTWGLDLSGSLEGASGVGGLLFVENFAGGASTLNAAATDEMGNVVALADMASGALTASYEYGPFGEVIRQSGPLAASNPIRWSSRYTDDETGLLYYGRRYYQPQTGRWLSKDPSGERGGKNLYGMCFNNPVRFYDYLGREPKPIDGGFGFSGWKDHASQISEDGNFKDRAGGRDNPHVGGGATGKSLLDHMKELTLNNCCIRNYRIAGHGWRIGQGAGVPSYHSDDEEGFNLDKTTGRPSANGDVRDINDLKVEIGKGTIKFCKTCTISIFACRISQDFVVALGAATGCKVVAAGGACQRNPNGGGWRSNADEKGDSDQFRQSDGGTPAKDIGHIFQPPLFP